MTGDSVMCLSCRLLEVQKQENGGVWPETVAVVLWGTDNIKTYGESLAQVRAPPGTSADPLPQSCRRRSMLRASPRLAVSMHYP